MTVDLDIPKPQLTNQQQPKPTSQSVRIVRWPAKRLPEGIGLSVQDGWNFGIGLGLALVIAVPFILGLAWLLLFIFLGILGVSL